MNNPHLKIFLLQLKEENYDTINEMIIAAPYEGAARLLAFMTYYNHPKSMHDLEKGFYSQSTDGHTLQKYHTRRLLDWIAWIDPEKSTCKEMEINMAGVLHTFHLPG